MLPPQLITRTKSQYSVMRKLLGLDNLAAGGRRRDQLYDLLGLRAIVEPRRDLPPDQAEAAATAACYRLQQLAFELCPPLAGRSKDYVAAPKANGYQSLHATLQLDGGAGGGDGGDAVADAWSASTTAQSTWEECDGAASGSTGGGSMDATSSPTAVTSWAANRAAAVSSAVASPVSPPNAVAAEVEAHVLRYCELQVRTVAMHAAAERGDAAHAGYKGRVDRRQVGVGWGRAPLRIATCPFCGMLAWGTLRSF
jgi:hypothetical protein